MYISKSFIPILKNNPSEAKIKSHQLMLRVGMIKQSLAGIYSWLPLGFKVMKKIEQIVREEQNKIGAQEILMPTIQPSDIWKESGRYDDYGDEMLRIKDRQGREMLYGPTNEELVTDIFRSSVKSYKSLPQLLYHIQWKFRDEVRPRFGIMRGREFYMKDAYSFDVNDEDAAFSYNKFFFSYLKTFKRLELSAIPMAADTGPIGGNLSHEFIILADTGESKIFTDKRVFDLDSEGSVMDRQSLQDLRKKYEQYYAVADEKFNKDEFEEKVSEENRLITKGIEVGHIFYFGDKYSKALNAAVDLPGGKKDFVKMGSYGIGVSRLVGAIIEAKYDEKDEIMKWPFSVAPYELAIIPMINKNDTSALDKANKLFKHFESKNIDTIIDDMDENLSSKIKKFNLIGVPYQIILGKKSDGDLLEFKEIGKDPKSLTIDQITQILTEQKITTIIVTHDSYEAFYLGTKCGIILDEQLKQFDDPYNVYHFPNSVEVVNFLNRGILIPAKVTGENSLESVDLGTITGDFIKHYPKGSEVQLLLQPEDLEHDDQSNLKLEVVDRKFRGTNFIYTLKTMSNKLIPVFVHSHHIHQHQVDEKFGIKRPINIDHIVCF